ncbi:alpha/beta fold hydrolase [Cupriavidus basilensis]
MVRYDTRGQGRSTAPGDAFTMEQLGGDVVAILDELSIAQAAFCGVSMGGLTGMWLGVHASERFPEDCARQHLP